MGLGIFELIDGLLAQKLRFDSISNNLANSNTSGFKRDTISFHQALAMANQSVTDFSPGPIRYTGNEFDLALESPGFFKIQTARGVRYTREGSFRLNADRVLVNKSGDPVLGLNGPITITEGNLSVERDGSVVVENETVGTLAVVDFKDRHLLSKEGACNYTYQGNERDAFPVENLSMQNGYLEQSNVNPTIEMVKMLQALRAFESAQKAIQCMDEITHMMVNEVGRSQ